MVPPSYPFDAAEYPRGEAHRPPIFTSRKYEKASKTQRISRVKNAWGLAGVARVRCAPVVDA
jgi:hypothetical protein